MHTSQLEKAARELRNVQKMAVNQWNAVYTLLMAVVVTKHISVRATHQFLNHKEYTLQ